MHFAKSLISKKLAFAAAIETFISSLPMSADNKGIAMAAVAIAFIAGQAYVDAHNGSPSSPKAADSERAPTQ